MSEQESVPARWNVMIDHNSREYERHKQIEKHKQQLRKIAYKNALDDGLVERKLLAHDDKQQDRKIFATMLNKNRTLNEIEQQKKLANMRRMREIAQSNRQKINELANSRGNILQRQAQNSLVSIQIGNPEEDHFKRDNNKKQLLDFYNQHLVEKRERQKQQKDYDRQLLFKQQQILEKREQDRQNERKRVLSHGQDQEIFRYYTSLNELGVKKQNELNNKLVEEAARVNREKEQQRDQRELQTKQRLIEDVKTSLLDQMQKNRDAKLEADKAKSQEKIMSKLAEGQLSRRGPAYSKQEYLAFLMKQEELHKRKKAQENGMNPLEYKMNLHDLQKTAAKGEPLHNASPLYIGYGDEHSNRKDQIYFKYMPPPQSSSRSNRSYNIPEDSLDEYQRKLDRSIVNRIKPTV